MITMVDMIQDEPYHIEGDFDTLLHDFVKTNSPKHLKTLFEENPGYDINKLDNKEPLLQIAIWNRSIFSVNLLLDYGLNLDNKQYKSILDYLELCRNNDQENAETYDEIKNLILSSKGEHFPIITLTRLYDKLNKLEIVGRQDGWEDGWGYFDVNIISEIFDEYGNIIENNLFFFFENTEYYKGMLEGLRDSYNEYKINEAQDNIL